MTRIAGDPLDSFLERRASQGGPRAGLQEASFFARQLLVQLAPAFEHISELAYHRDVNAHNILVD
eukprot:909128-Pyramimonas_sp.AAC.1